MDDRLPRIVTPYPGPKAREWLERLRRVEGAGMRTAGSEPPLSMWESAQGALVCDPDGNRFLDLYAGFAVSNIGHNHPRVVAAVREQAERLMHVSSAYPTRTRIELMERLVALAPQGLTRGLFTITGGQANDLALRIARKATGRTEVITFTGSYFGRDSGVLGVSGKAGFRRGLGTPPGAHFLPYPYPFRCPFGNRHADPDDCALETIAYLERSLRDPASGIGDVAAVIVEPAQGNGGVVIPPPSFLPGLRRLCDEFGILLIFDEIQSGFGRTGRLWAGEHWNVVPDLMTIGKGIGGGLPVAAVLGRERPMAALDPGQHTSTFLTNALTHAAALAALEVMTEERLWERSASLGEWLLGELGAALGKHPIVGEIRGLGLFIGIELVRDRETREPAPDRTAKCLKAARDLGLLLGLSGRFDNILKLAPPLVVERVQLEEAVRILREIVFAGQE